MARHRVILILSTGAVAAGVMACGEVPFAQDPLPGYTLLTEEVWSGGEIVLVSPRFQQMHDSIRLVIADDTLPEAHRAGDTVKFRADSILSGTYPIAVVPFVPPTLESLAEVAVRGFQACYPGPLMSGFALPWPRGSVEPTFVADGAESAIIANARTGLGRSAVPEEQHRPGWGMGPGPAYDPSSVVLSGTRATPDAPDSSCVWQLHPTPERGECIGRNAGYNIALVGPGKWVIATHHFTERTWTDDSLYFLEEPNAIALSPRGDFLVVSGASDDGQLVFPVADEPALHIPALYRAEAPAVFSPDGDTVYMAGWVKFSDFVSTLVVVDLARPSEPIRSREIGPVIPIDIAFDMAAPYLYVVTFDGDITVINRRTLEKVGQLDLPSGECQTPGDGLMTRLVLSRNHSALYAVRSTNQRGPASESLIYRFDLVAPE